MTRLLAVLLLSFILLQAFLMPAAARAYVCPTITYDISLTDVTSNSVVFTDRYCDNVGDGFFMAGTPDVDNSFVLEYGTEPGVYNNRINLGNIPVNGHNLMAVTQGTGETHCWTGRYTMRDLTPCTIYYARVILMIQYNDCPAFNYNKDFKFTTLGCMIRSSAPGGAGTTSTNTAPATQPIGISNIVVQSATIATPKVAPGQSVDVTASVSNKASASGAAKLTLYVNGEKVESKGVTLSSGQTEPVHFSLSRNEPGIYNVYVDGVSAGSFEVDPFVNNDMLIYGIIAVFVLGIAGTLYFIVRRRIA